MEDAVLQLNRCLYGMKNSPRYWFNTIKATFINFLEFEQSKEDQCLFFNNKLKAIVLLDVDDCLIFAHDKSALDQIIAGLKQKHDLEEQEMARNVYGYLGIEIDMSGDAVKPLQTGLTKKVLKMVGLENCNLCETPAKEGYLGADLNGDPFDEDWECASMVLGMLMYLTHTRPNIQQAVHACARYAHDPKHSHGNAIKKICWHLEGMKARGIRVKRTTLDPKNLQANCYVDALFAPVWTQDNDDDNTKSQMGHVIQIDDVPISWCSRKTGAYSSLVDRSGIDCIVNSYA